MCHGDYRYCDCLANTKKRIGDAMDDAVKSDRAAWNRNINNVINDIRNKALEEAAIKLEEHNCACEGDCCHGYGAVEEIRMLKSK